MVGCFGKSTDCTAVVVWWWLFQLTVSPLHPAADTSVSWKEAENVWSATPTGKLSAPASENTTLQPSHGANCQLSFCKLLNVYLYESQVVLQPIIVNLLCVCWLFALQPGWNVKDEYVVVVSLQVHCEYIEAQLLADAFPSLKIPLCFWWETHGNMESSCWDFTEASKRSRNMALHFDIIMPKSICRLHNNFKYNLRIYLFHTVKEKFWNKQTKKLKDWEVLLALW